MLDGGVEGVGDAAAQSPAIVATTGARLGERWSTFRARVPFVVALVLVAFVLRAIAAVALEQILLRAGHGGFLGADDVAYDHVAWQQAQAWLGDGPPVSAADRYLLN